MYNDLDVSEIRKVKDSALLLNHFKGLFMKRMISTLRMWKTYITLSFLSILVIVALGAIVNLVMGAIPPTPTPLSMSSFANYESTNQFTIDTTSNLDDNFLTSIKTHLQNEATTISEVGNLTGFLAAEADNDIIDYARTYIVGVSKTEVPPYHFCSNEPPNKRMVTMRYNPMPYNSRPLATNQLSNFLLLVRGKTAKISMTSAPMVYRSDLTATGIAESDFSVSSMQYMVMMTITMSLLLGIFIIFPLKERVTNAKQVQLMAGVSPIVFWFTNFVWDFIIYLVIGMIYILILYLFDTRNIFHSNGGFGALVLLIIFLGLAGIPWAYIMNFAFNSAPSAFAIMIISAIVLGICGSLAVIFLR